ncbi:GEM-interacting protein-like [Grus americana]|uniref:GEM-interacting protein-like n=1 Tax=Grus americana TaxID=9117 RepID=UPI0024082D9A|nr:GEM-interacting protein-like [Grus americana]
MARLLREAILPVSLSALMRSHLDYCIQPQGLQYKEDMDLLERVQRHYVKNKVSETNEELRKKGKNGVLWKPTHDRSSLAKVLESSVAEKALGVLVDTKSTRRQQGALAQRRPRATGQRPAPAALPGPGPAAGADQQEGGSRGCRPGGGGGPAHQLPRPRLALRLLHRHFPVSLAATSRARAGQRLCPAPRAFVLPLQLSPRGRAVPAPASARSLGSSGHSGCFSSLSCRSSRALKELWLSALLGPPEGVEGARVTQLPSIKLLLQELSGRNAVSVPPASALPSPEAAPAQHQAGAEQRPPPVPSGGSSERGLGPSAGECGCRRRGQDGPSPLLCPAATPAALALLLPFPQGTAVPIALRRDRAEPRGPSLPNGAPLPLPLPCFQRRGDSAQRPRERSPGASPPPRLFALLSLAAGGTRRRRRGLPWPFARRRGSSAAAEAAGQSGSGGRGALFGQPLAALCSQDGTLPQPIQDLLALLAEHGPSTEGIFRLAVKEHVSRELREALDSGAEVHLESQPAHVLAVLLKDFLRKIPSKLLGAELYEEWMSALQKTSRQEKLAALREVAGKLPQANLVLLKSLLSLLQRISRNAASSRMTAGNLAICVGPNLLSPPEEQTLPLDALVQVTGQVTGLVEFLIEHHGDLFGEEVAGLAGTSAEESPAPGPEAETAEVPPVAAESQHLKSSSGERR